MEIRCRVMLAMSAILACASASHLRRPCEDSGYCSVGVSKAWRGDIKESSQFKAMLESVAYKKELILTTYQKNGPPYTHADEVLQLHSELMTMGYAHHILVTLGPEHCESVPNNDLSCVWDSDLLPWDIQGPFWAVVSLRWKVLARAIRLGYNVMGLDSDFIFYSDPYIHLKNPPLSTIHMMCHPEGGSPFNCNAGFIYVQNVRPDGPISWVWREYVRMTRRLADDGYKFASQFNGEKKNCFEHEQLQIGQALATATVGRPAYHGIVEYCKRHYNLTTRKSTTLTGAEAGELLNQIVHAPDRVKYMEVLPNGEFMRRVGFRDLPQASKVMHFAQMTVPNLNYVNPEELGGRIFPDPGPLSKAWDDMLKSDCPDCPVWDDLRPLPNGGVDPIDQILGPDFKSVHVNTTQLNLFIDPSIPQETYAQTPGWLISSLTLGRWGTILGRNAPRPGFPVLSHVHFWHMQTERDQKSMLRKVVGRYNYTVGEEVAKAGGFASPYMMGQAVKRVLMLSPEIDLSRTRTGKEFAFILAGLFQLAALSHRTLVLPSLPCQTNWLHDPWLLSHESSNKTLCLVPMVNTQRWPIPFPLAVDTQGELVGGWARRSLRGSQERMEDGWWDRQHFTMILPQMWDPSCTRGHHAIILPEFHHWRKNNPATRDAHLWPVPGNTVFLPSPGSSKLNLNPPSPASGDSAAVPPGHIVQSSDAPGWSLYDIQAAIPVDQAVQAMRQFSEEPILYVGHPVSVVSSKEPETSAGVGGAILKQRRLAAAEGLGPHGKMHVSPAAALQRVNGRLSNSRCKTIWEDSEVASSGKVVDLSHGTPVEVVDKKYLRQTL